MKVLIIAFVFFGCASAATVESIKNDLKKFINATRDSTVDELQATNLPFYNDAKEQNTFYLKVQLGSSSKAFESVVAYIKNVRSDDKIFTDSLDPQLNEFRAKIDSLFATAATKVASSACPSKIISSLSKFSTALQTKIKAAVRNVRKQNEVTAKDYHELFMIQGGFKPYETLVKFCSKPANAKNSDCVGLETLATRGSYTAENYQGLFDNFNRSYLELTAGVITYPENIDVDFENALNIACK